MAETLCPPGPPDSPERAADIAPIEQAIRCRLGHRIRDLRIWIEPHGLVIDGGASSYYDKQMAQHLVRELSGLGVADNRIVVDSVLEADRWGGYRSFPETVVLSRDCRGKAPIEV